MCVCDSNLCDLVFTYTAETQSSRGDSHPCVSALLGRGQQGWVKQTELLHCLPVSVSVQYQEAVLQHSGCCTQKYTHMH